MQNRLRIAAWDPLELLLVRDSGNQNVSHSYILVHRDDKRWLISRLA